MLSIKEKNDLLSLKDMVKTYQKVMEFDLVCDCCNQTKYSLLLKINFTEKSDGKRTLDLIELSIDKEYTHGWNPAFFGYDTHCLISFFQLALTEELDEKHSKDDLQTLAGNLLKISMKECKALQIYLKIM